MSIAAAPKVVVWPSAAKTIVELMKEFTYGGVRLLDGGYTMVYVSDLISPSIISICTCGLWLSSASLGCASG
jgi:hypothetical protein